MKKTVILLIICVLLFVSAMALTACLSLSDNDDKNTETEETGKTEDNAEETERYELFPGENFLRAPETYEGITQEQEDEIKELRENRFSGYYVYDEMVIIGKADPEASKLDWETAKSIILSNDDIFVILDKFREIQYYPDVVWEGGSGCHVEFWPDGSGKESIHIIRWTIAYDIFDDEGNSIYHEEYHI